VLEVHVLARGSLYPLHERFHLVRSVRLPCARKSRQLNVLQPPEQQTDDGGITLMVVHVLPHRHRRNHVLVKVGPADEADNLSRDDKQLAVWSDKYFENVITTTDLVEKKEASRVGTEGTREEGGIR
jgi:hypothetical protein